MANVAELNRMLDLTVAAMGASNPVLQICVVPLNSNRFPLAKMLSCGGEVLMVIKARQLTFSRGLGWNVKAVKKVKEERKGCEWPVAVVLFANACIWLGL